MTRERISRILELREILLSIQTGFSLVNAVVCAVLESISGLEPSSVITEPRYLKLVTVSSFCPFTLISVPRSSRKSLPRSSRQSDHTKISDHRKETQTALVWSCFPFIRSGKNHLASHSERGKKTRQTEEEVRRQHQGMDGPGVLQVPEGSGEQGKLGETGCEIICGAPTILMVKG